MDAHSYNVTVRRDVVDSEVLFVATVKEFPHVVVYSESAAEAYEEAVGVVRDLVEAAEEEGRVAPTPSSVSSEYTGRVTLRMPPSLHRKLAAAAEDGDVSLNLLIVTTLAEAMGAMAAQVNTQGITAEAQPVETNASVTSYSLDPGAVPTPQTQPFKLYAVN
jgi:predicted HicB family RNase H-like nuclease